LFVWNIVITQKTGLMLGIIGVECRGRREVLYQMVMGRSAVPHGTGIRTFLVL